MGKTLKYVSEFTFPSAGKTAAPGYAKGGMAMGNMKSTKPAASPAPKSDMLYSKKENTAKTLLHDGKGAPMPHAKGSVNMAKGGPAMSAGRAAMAQAAANRQPAQAQAMMRPPTMGGGVPAAHQQRLAQLAAMQTRAQAQPMPQVKPPMPQMGNRPQVSQPLMPGGAGAADEMRPAVMKRGGMAKGGMSDCGMAKGGMSKVGKVMGEFKAGELHSGSKNGPMVTNRKQAVAIGMSEARKATKK